MSLPPEKYRVTGLVSREWTDEVVSLAASVSTARLLPPDDLAEGLKADVVFITTQDAKVRGAVDEYRGLIADSTVFHTSGGSTPSSILEPLNS